MRKIVRFVWASLILSILISCHSDEEGSVDTINRLNRGAVYELFVRQFTDQGDFSSITPRLGELKKLGIKTILLLPIHPIGKINQEGSEGSPYSPKDIYAINPNYGDEVDLKELINAAHQYDMNVVLDLVLNHTSWDCPWIDEHPEWYKRNEDGEIIPPFETWWDVAALDLNNAELRRELLNAIRYWLNNFPFDGIRFDSATLLPNIFWSEFELMESKEFPTTIFIGEWGDGDPNLIDFDAIYPWSSLETLELIWEGGAAEWLTSTVAETNNSNVLRYISDHDDLAWGRTSMEKFKSYEGIKAAVVSFMLLPGFPMIYNGQEIGTEGTIPITENYSYNWNLNPETKEFYSEILTLRSKYDAFLSGKFIPVESDNTQNIVSYKRVSSTHELLILVNVRESFQYFKPLPEIKGKWQDISNHEEIVMDENILLSPYQYLLLKKYKSTPR